MKDEAATALEEMFAAAKAGKCRYVYCIWLS